MSVMRSVRTRLALSHLAVVVAGAVTVLVVGRLVAPASFENHMASMGMAGMGAMGQMMAPDLRAGFDAAVAQALWVSVGVSFVVALAAAFVATGRVAAPIDRVRVATRRLAEGRYSERVEAPAEVELAALAEDVNHLAAALEQTETRRVRLMGDVSHELRHPITTLKGYLEGMLDGVLEPSPEILAAMAGEAARLDRLASDLNLVSRAEEGAVKLEPRPVDIESLVASIAARLGPQFEDEGVVLRTAGGPPVSVDADPDRLTQILTNLIGNALTYTPTGGRVDVAWTNQPETVEITVSDTGSGLTADDLERVFERFYRGDRSAPGGTGVGLTIARTMARLHGGDITASSAGPGRGSTFTLTLPSIDR